MSAWRNSWWTPISGNGEGGGTFLRFTVVMMMGHIPRRKMKTSLLPFLFLGVIFALAGFLAGSIPGHAQNGGPRTQPAGRMLSPVLQAENIRRTPAGNRQHQEGQMIREVSAVAETERSSPLYANGRPAPVTLHITADGRPYANKEVQVIQSASFEVRGLPATALTLPLARTERHDFSYKPG